MKNKDYVSYEVAKILKEKGFNEYCSKEYHVGDAKKIHSVGEEYYNRSYDIERNTDKKENKIAAPTLYEVQKWMREIYDIKVMPRFFDEKNNYGFEIYLAREWYCTHSNIDSYEESLNAGIKEALSFL